MTTPVFIGWDSKEPLAYQACVNSVHKHSPGWQCIPIKQPEVRANRLYTRQPDAKASTEFSLTRFLTPFLADSRYSQFALFCDCDFIFTRDLNDLLREADDPTKAVWVVQHPCTELWQKAHGRAAAAVKMNGAEQRLYPRKWWSALILWNLKHAANLGKLWISDVNRREPSWLHQFGWLQDNEIGALDPRWHWLDGYNDPLIEDAVPWGVHYTRGTPEHGPEWAATRFARLWHMYLDNS